MTTPVTSPEWLILNRTVLLMKSMAADDEFVPSQEEATMSASPNGVLVWKTLEGHETNQQSGRIVNVPDPAILVTHMPVKGGNSGVNKGDDEVVTIVIQIVAAASGPHASQKPIRTYTDWMNRIRHYVLNDENLFRQDFDPRTADPYLIMPRDRVPADPQQLYRHEQSVAAFSFYVKVRHYRSWGHDR